MLQPSRGHDDLYTARPLEPRKQIVGEQGAMGSSRGRQPLVHKQHGPSISRGKGGSTNPPLSATHYLRPILVFGAGRRIAHCLVHSSIPRAACGSGECSAPLEHGVPGVACPTASASTLGHSPPGHLQLALALCPSCARPAYSLPPFPRDNHPGRDHKWPAASSTALCSSQRSCKHS